MGSYNEIINKCVNHNSNALKEFEKEERWGLRFKNLVEFVDKYRNSIEDDTTVFVERLSDSLINKYDKHNLMFPDDCLVPSEESGFPEQDIDINIEENYSRYFNPLAIHYTDKSACLNKPVITIQSLY